MALGVEAADVIAAVGDAVEHYTPGDEVMTHPVPLRDQGTWAPRLIAPVAGLARKPAAVSWQAAGAFPVPGLTAAQVIDDALAVRADDVVLVNGAGGVTGGLLVSVAAARGAEVIATAGPANRARVRGLGAAHLLDYHDPHWPDEARAMTAGLGVTAAANAAPPPRSTRSETAVAKPRLPRIHPSNGEGSPSRARCATRWPSARRHGRPARRWHTGITVAATFSLPEAAPALAAARAGRSARAVVLAL
jgi:NADPH:quinone reductase-like Zn-dependent oxidoreductase